MPWQGVSPDWQNYHWGSTLGRRPGIGNLSRLPKRVRGVRIILPQAETINAIECKPMEAKEAGI